MARDTVGTVGILVRATSDDRDVAGGLTFQDADLLPFINAAQRRLARALTNVGSKIALNDITYIGATVIVAGTTKIDFASTPALPDDLVFPLVLWEKQVGATDSTYTEMDQQQEHIPLVDQTDTLRYWAVTGQGTSGTLAINLLGATTDRVVKMEYFRQIPDLTISAPTDKLLIPNSADAVAADVLRRVHESRGEGELAAAADKDFLSHFDDLKRVYVRGAQRRPRRRAAYGYLINRF